jgi:hypothetical protein
LEAAAFEVL